MTPLAAVWGTDGEPEQVSVGRKLVQASHMAVASPPPRPLLVPTVPTLASGTGCREVCLPHLDPAAQEGAFWNRTQAQC